VGGHQLRVLRVQRRALPRHARDHGRHVLAAPHLDGRAGRAFHQPHLEREAFEMATYVGANPYPWPYNGDLRPENTALLVIDMQTDFCGIGGNVDKMGYGLSRTRAPIEPITAVLPATRTAGARKPPPPASRPPHPLAPPAA